MTVDIGSGYTRPKGYRSDFVIRIIKSGLLLFPVAFIGLLVWLKLRHPWFYALDFMKEDGPIEWGTSIPYFIAVIVSALVSVSLYRNGQRLFGVLYALLAVGLFFIGGEEISWGQRVFGWQTTHFFAEHNIQDETNLHNMLGRYALEGLYIIVGFYGAFSRLLTPSRIRQRYPMGSNLLTPNYFLVLYFLPVFALYVYYDYLADPLVHWFGPQFGFSNSKGGEAHTQFMRAKDQEPIEFLLSLGFLLFVSINCLRYTRLFRRWPRAGSQAEPA